MSDTQLAFTKKNELVQGGHGTLQGLRAQAQGG